MHFVAQAQHVDVAETFGMTWLEIEILYEIRQRIASPAHKHQLPQGHFADPDTTLKQATQTIYNVYRDIVRIHKANGITDDIRLDSTNLPMHRLALLGVLNPIQATCFHIAIDEDETKEVTTRLLRMLGPVEENDYHKLRGGTLDIRPTKINLQPPITWERPPIETNPSAHRQTAPRKRRRGAPIQPQHEQETTIRKKEGSRPPRQPTTLHNYFRPTIRR